MRLQAREAVERFVQEVLDYPANATELQNHPDRMKLARDLWHEGLVLVYRLLFVLKLESTDDPARSFSFTSSSLWRNTFSPGVALAARVRDVLDHGQETGRYLEDALRNLFRMFSDGLECSELHIKPLGGALFGPEAAPLLDRRLQWGERAVAYLLDRLLWTQRKRGEATRQRVHYGALDVEDLGRVYEALLELDAGISTEPLCRLRRQKLEVVVPAAQGDKCRPVTAPIAGQEAEDETDEESAEEPEEETTASAKKTKIEWIEEIPPYRFFLRVGLGRKATGSYYTPHSFVRFLVQETLGPLCAARSPQDDPNPGEILKLKVLDPAMGSGHFLVEACRFLAEKLYEACRLCDERADPAERRAENAIDEKVKADALAEATKWRGRVVDLPDPKDELLQYLPSRAPEGAESGISQRRALALCRRLVAVHCLYGVDKNRLAVELAKLSLWIESHGEGLPLTFLDHRLVEGDSLTGPFFDQLLKYPNSGEPLEGLFANGLRQKLTSALTDALRHVADLESTVGTTLSETEFKKAAKTRLDGALAPFRAISAAWAGQVLSGEATGAEYAEVVRSALSGENHFDPKSEPNPLPYELVFPEVFFPTGRLTDRYGFDVVLGNPPWDAIQFKSKEFLASFDIELLNAPTQRERLEAENRVLADAVCSRAFEGYKRSFEAKKRSNDQLYKYQKVYIEGDLAGRQLDEFRIFMERNTQLLRNGGWTGVVVPSAFHANEGATSIRKLYLEQLNLRFCYSFENRKKLFEIDSRFKFAAVTASSGRPTDHFSCAFYLQDDQWLFSEERQHSLTYNRQFVLKTGREYLNFVEARSQVDVSILDALYSNEETFEDLTDKYSVKLQGPPAALHMSHESGRFVRADTAGTGDSRRLADFLDFNLTENLGLIEGKHFWHYDDLWGDPPRYVLPFQNVGDLTAHLLRSRHYQLAVRAVASSTNERTVVACVLPPGVAVGHSVLIDASAGHQPYPSLLVLMALLNSFCFDWLTRQQVGANVTLFVLRGLPVPPVDRVRQFLAHASARLQCNRPAYRPLWNAVMNGEWREDQSRYTWPVIMNVRARWELRAAVDAVVANCYGLDLVQYDRLLSSFGHSSFPGARDLCLAKFDELTVSGLETFTKRHDRYQDIPLTEALPTPVVDLPGLPDGGQDRGVFALAPPCTVPKRGRKR